MCVPRWFQRTSRLSRRPVGGMCVLIFWTALRGSQSSSVKVSQVMNRGFWSTTPRQNAKVGNDTLQILPVPRKRELPNPKSNRCSFVFLTVRRASTRNLCHQDKLSIKLLTGSPWKTQEKGGTCVTRHCTHLDAAPRQRPMSHGSTHQWIFSRKKHSCSSSAPPIHRISVPVTSFYSSGSKTTWKGAILVVWIISRRA